MLKVSQVQNLLGLFGDGAHVDLLQAALVDHDHAAEALGERLQLQVPTPLSALPHGLQVALEGAILVFVQERTEEILVPGHEVAGLIPHEHVRSLIAVKLVSEGSEQAVAVPTHVSEHEAQRGDLLGEGCEVLAVLTGEFESIALGHLFAQLHLHLLVLAALHPRLLDHALPVLLFPHNSLINNIIDRSDPLMPALLYNIYQVNLNSVQEHAGQSRFLPPLARVWVGEDVKLPARLRPGAARELPHH